MVRINLLPELGSKYSIILIKNYFKLEGFPYRLAIFLGPGSIEKEKIWPFPRPRAEKVALHPKSQSVGAIHESPLLRPPRKMDISFLQTCLYELGAKRL
jgi:hypothetical protein